MIFYAAANDPLLNVTPVYVRMKNKTQILPHGKRRYRVELGNPKFNKLIILL
jgi:hypothetical protein